LGQAAHEDLVTYLMVTAEVGLPDAVLSQIIVNAQDVIEGLFTAITVQLSGLN